MNPPAARVHITRNGGRTRILVCACVRAGLTPYIGHCSAGW